MSAFAQEVLSQSASTTDPIGDVPGFPSWIDIVGADVSVGENGILVFGMDVAQPIPDSPDNYVGYIWGIDADTSFSSPIGYQINDIETEFHVRLAYDFGMWFAVIDVLDQNTVIPSNGYAFSNGRQRIEVFVDPVDLGSAESLYLVSWIAWPGSIPEWAPNTGHVTLYPTLDCQVDIKPGLCPNPLQIRMREVRPEDSPVERFNVRKPPPNIDELTKPLLPVAILGSADFDVIDINPATVLVEGVPPFQWHIEDVAAPVGEESEECECTTLGADGYPDLILEYFEGRVVQELGTVFDSDTIPLIITGELSEGRTIVGSDCVVIHFEYVKSNRSTAPDAGSSTVQLIGNYPNPFNPVTEISFSLTSASDVKLEIYNVMGQKVATVVDRFMEAGEHTVRWDASSFSSGVYFYKLEAGEFVETRKMVLLK